MKLVEILKPDFVYEDERGILSQITHTPYGQVNSAFTKKGAIRGRFHYHKTTQEIFYIITGAVKVSVYRDDISEEHIFKTGDMFLVPEYVRHNFDFKEDTYMVSFYTSCVELPDGTMDIVND